MPGRIGRNGRKVYHRGTVYGIMTTGARAIREPVRAQTRYHPNNRRMGEWISSAPPDLHYPRRRPVQRKNNNNGPRHPLAIETRLVDRRALNEAETTYGLLCSELTKGVKKNPRRPNPLLVAKKARKLASTLRTALDPPICANKWRKFADRLERTTRDGKTYAKTMYGGFLQIAPEVIGVYHRLQHVKRVVGIILGFLILQI